MDNSKLPNKKVHELQKEFLANNWDLEMLLQEISVHDEWDNDSTDVFESDGGWYAVSTWKHGIIAYINDEAEAFHYRLDLINRILNS